MSRIQPLIRALNASKARYTTAAPPSTSATPTLKTAAIPTLKTTSTTLNATSTTLNATSTTPTLKTTTTPTLKTNTTPTLKTTSTGPTLNALPLRYHVARSSKNSFPVYTDTKRGGNLRLTIVRRVAGNADALRGELVVWLKRKDDHVTVNPLNKHVIVKGHFKKQIDEFLRLRGF